MIKGITHAHIGTIWYHSEPSDVPYSLNQFLGWDFFLPLLTARRLKEILMKAIRRFGILRFVKLITDKQIVNCDRENFGKITHCTVGSA